MRETGLVVTDLPFARYALSLTAPGFAPFNQTIEIRNEVPVALAITLRLTVQSTLVEVVEGSRLIDPFEIGSPVIFGRQMVQAAGVAQPGREVSILVNQAPGWLLEANGVLHPRGSEYDLQFVIDGLPWYQNRSPAFAPAIPAGIESVRVLTAGIPAEYGRKLGGVVELDTDRNLGFGLHGEIDFEAASHGIRDVTADTSQGFRWGGWTGRGRYFSTDRYLDPPVFQNFSNRASGAEIGSSWDLRLSDRTRFHLIGFYSGLDHQVPNELIQQQAGQRQQVHSREAIFGGSLEHIVSTDKVLRIHSLYRRPRFTLSSNPFSTPIYVEQSRGNHEWQTRADFSWQRGDHSWKSGVDAIWTGLNERLHYRITDDDAFDAATRPELHFTGRRNGMQYSGYLQYGFQRQAWSLAAGVRWDRYALLAPATGVSPRFSMAKTFPRLGLRLHASYDRVFQTPVLENLLMASSTRLESVNPNVLRLPLTPGRAHFYEAGFSQQATTHMRLDGTVFLRDWQHFSDDEVLLATGVSFPLTLAHARIKGGEIRLVIPGWGRVSGFASYSNQVGMARGPITGGLLIGSEVVPTGAFPISQDQRNTARGRLRLEGPRATWFAFGGQYGSGLPIELDDDEDLQQLAQQHDQAILRRVNLVRGRVLPNWSLDAAVGAELFKHERLKLTLDASVTNLTDRFNVVNFAGLFSGTAIAEPRTVGVRVRFSF